MAAWDNIAFDYPAEVPTMLSPEELRYLYWLGRDVWTDSGAIVEIGPWLGGSTVSLLIGARDRVRPANHKLHAFDNFIWHDFMSDRAPISLADGSNFQRYFEANVSNFHESLVIHRQSLPDDENPLDDFAASVSQGVGAQIEPFAWSEGGPIEILFVDGAKTWSGMKRLLGVVNSHLMPGASLLVFQDYKDWAAYWVPVVAEQLADYLELIHICDANTVTFRLKEQIPASVIDGLEKFESLALEDGLSLLNAAGQRLDDHDDRLGAAILQASKIRYCLNKGSLDKAIEYLRACESGWPGVVHTDVVDRARSWLEKETGRRFPPSMRWRALSSRVFARRVVRKIKSLAMTPRPA